MDPISTKKSGHAASAGNDGPKTRSNGKKEKPNEFDDEGETLIKNEKNTLRDEIGGNPKSSMWGNEVE